ncbi:androglobin-like [Photinus pyralis]|nr:androglobin-like [Photinus pyralis]
MPKSLPCAQWCRPNHFFPNARITMCKESNCPDLINGNKHLLHSEFTRSFISAVGVLNYLGLHRPSHIEYVTPTYQPTTDGIPWKPWHHIYSMCKAGKGQKHNPQVNQLGKYIVRLFWMGCWRKITVDDMLPINHSQELLFPALHECDSPNTEIQIWPFILCKALLKLANLSQIQTEDDELLDFDIVHCLTGWFPYKINVSGMNMDEVWDMCAAYTDHFSWSDKSDSKSTKSAPSVSEGDSRCSSYHVLGVCSDMRDVDEDAVPDLSPCWSHQFLIDQTRDIPLIQPEPLPDLERWKRFRWLAWAISKGLWPAPQLEPIKCVKLVTDFRKCTGGLRTHSKRSLDIKESVAVIEDIMKTGKSKGCNYSTSGEQTDGCAWIDFNKLAPQLSQLSVYFKLSGFKNITKISDVLFKDSDKAKVDKGKKSKEAEGNSVKFIPWTSAISLSRNESLYLFCDDLDSKFLVVNIAQVGNLGALFRTSDTSDGGSENMDIAFNPFAYLTIEDYKWQTEKAGDILVSVNTFGTRSSIASISPGRRVFRMWVKSDTSFIIHLLSDSEIVCGSLESVLEYMSHETKRILQLSDQISSSYGQMVQEFGRPEFGTKLRSFYKSYAPQCLLPKTVLITVHECFMETFLKMVQDRSPKSEIEDRLFALKVLFLNPNIRCEHQHKYNFPREGDEISNTEDIALEKLKNTSAMKIQAFFRQKMISNLKRIHNESHREYRKVFDCLKRIYADIFNVSNRMIHCCDLIRKFLLGNGKMSNMHQYYSIIQDLNCTTHLQQFMGSVRVSRSSWVAIVRQVFHCIRLKEAIVKINLFCDLRKYVVRVFDNDNNKEIVRHFNNVLVNEYCPNVNGYTVLCYGWSEDESECKWKLDFSTLRMSSDYSLLIPNAVLYNFVLKHNYLPNVNDYMCRSIININHDVSVTLRLSANLDNVIVRFRCLNELGQIFGEIVGNQSVILPNVMLKYVPVIETEDVSVSPKISRSKSSATIMHSKGSRRSVRSIDKLSESKRTSKESRKSQESPKEVRYKDTTYLVEGFVIGNSWPLTRTEWEVVEEIKSKRSIESLYARVSKSSSVNTLKKIRSHSAGSLSSADKKTSSTLLPISPFWTLEVISTISDMVTAQIDNRRENEMIEIKKKWYGDDPKHYFKSKLLRDEYLQSHYLPFQRSQTSEDHLDSTVEERYSSTMSSEKLKSTDRVIEASNLSVASETRTNEKPVPPDKVLPPLHLLDYMKGEGDKVLSHVKCDEEDQAERLNRLQSISDFGDAHERFKYDLCNFLNEELGRYKLLQQFYAGCRNQSKELMYTAYGMRDKVVDDIMKNYFGQQPSVLQEPKKRK